MRTINVPLKYLHLQCISCYRSISGTCNNTEYCFNTCLYDKYCLMSKNIHKLEFKLNTVTHKLNLFKTDSKWSNCFQASLQYLVNTIYLQQWFLFACLHNYVNCDRSYLELKVKCVWGATRTKGENSPHSAWSGQTPTPEASGRRCTPWSSRPLAPPTGEGRLNAQGLKSNSKNS